MTKNISKKFLNNVEAYTDPDIVWSVGLLIQPSTVPEYAPFMRFGWAEQGTDADSYQIGWTVQDAYAAAGQGPLDWMVRGEEDNVVGYKRKGFYTGPLAGMSKPKKGILKNAVLSYADGAWGQPACKLDPINYDDTVSWISLRGGQIEDGGSWTGVNDPGGIDCTVDGFALFKVDPVLKTGDPATVGDGFDWDNTNNNAEGWRDYLLCPSDADGTFSAARLGKLEFVMAGTLSSGRQFYGSNKFALTATTVTITVS